jgi:hypothetical protein
VNHEKNGFFLVLMALKNAWAGEQLQSAQEKMQFEADWVVENCVLPSGAITMRPHNNGNSGTINPWFASQAALGLLAAGPAYYGVVRNWLQWYINHINIDNPYPATGNFMGTIFIHRVVDGVESRETVQEHAYTATDNWSGIFFVLLQEYLNKTGDESVYLENESRIDLIVQALDNVYVSSQHLTQAAPDKTIKYTMDNIVTWRAYKDMAVIRQRFGRSYLVYENRAILVREAIEDELFDPDKREYVSFLGDTSVDWGVFYADAVANVYGLIFGLPEQNARRHELWDRFKTNQADWTIHSLENTDYPWAMVGVAGVKADDRSSVIVFEQNLRRRLGEGLRSSVWWHAGEAGMYMLLLASLNDYYINDGPSMSGDWSSVPVEGVDAPATQFYPHVGTGYLYSQQHTGVKSLTYRFDDLATGDYDVYWVYKPYSNRATSIRFKVRREGYSDYNEYLNQKLPLSGIVTEHIGQFHFQGGGLNYIYVNSTDPDGTVSSDAVILVPHF